VLDMIGVDDWDRVQAYVRAGGRSAVAQFAGRSPPPAIIATMREAAAPIAIGRKELDAAATAAWQAYRRCGMSP
jgi:hypothetical protein